MSTYTNIPGQLIQDLRNGKITNRMFNVVVWLLSRANFKTGVCIMVSAKRILKETWNEDEEDCPGVRTIQRTLTRLHNCGYIQSHCKRGSKRSYKVTVNNFLIAKKDDDGVVVRDADGVAETIILNPAETLDWRELRSCGVADDDAENGKAMSGRCRRRDADVTGTCRGRDADVSIIHHTTSDSSLSPLPSDSSLLPSKTVSKSVSKLVKSAASPPTTNNTRVLTDEENYLLLGWIGRRFKVDQVRTKLYERIRDAHPDFHWTEYNLQMLEDLLKRKDWARNITTMDDFAFRWSSSGDTSLYGQVMRMAVVPEPPDPPQPKPTDQKASTNEFLDRITEKYAWGRAVSESNMKLFSGLRNSDKEWQDKDILTKLVENAGFTQEELSAAILWSCQTAETGDLAYDRFMTTLDMVKFAHKVRMVRAAEGDDAAELLLSDDPELDAELEAEEAGAR